ncbi:MAG TPA: hypothetical protein PLJ35_10885 [Anaerolineae bacterium]|nr:hypothetical protein [Anaerolineae bacterium]HOQ99312.1 hypothetical protein [Anaerolineae bacterium]
MRAHPERTAWFVVWCAFITFCVLVVAVPLGARYVLHYATAVRPARLEVLEGTARLTNPATGRLDAYTKDDKSVDVGEGIVIQLDDKSQVDLRFFDGSYVRIYGPSDLAVERLRAPRFGRGVTPNTVWLRVLRGRLSVVTPKSLRSVAPNYVLHLSELGAEAALHDDGLYGVEVELAGGEVWAHRGSAVVTAHGGRVQLLSLERTTLAPGASPTAPIAGAKNLIVNGDLSQGFDGWTYVTEPSIDEPNLDGTATLTTDGGSRAVRFFRSGSGGRHGATIIQQDFAKPLPEPVSSLVIRANVKIVSQSLPGGGDRASEYPLMIRMRYRDEYGSENEWVHGFFAGNPQGFPTLNGTRVPRGEWYIFESGNLLAEGNRFGQLSPRPVRIVWIKVYGSGWDYESLLGSISLEVQ